MEPSLHGDGWDVQLGNRTVHLSYDSLIPSIVTEDDVVLLELRTIQGEAMTKQTLADERIVRYDHAGTSNFDEFSGPFTSAKLTGYYVYLLRFHPYVELPSTSVLSFKTVLQPM